MDDYQRPDRAEEETARRRRRDGSGLTRPLNLEVPEHIREKLASEGRSPRWVNDIKGRVADLTTRDDYDIVEGVNRRKVDTIDGEPVYAVLLSKPDNFIAEDRAAADQRRRDVEAARFDPRGDAPEGQLGAKTYVDSASKISRRNEVS